MTRPKWRLNRSILFIFISMILIKQSNCVKCHDCVGMDCMGNFCHGDYCVVSQYAPRWGSIRWGESEFVKGCLNGTMLSKDIRNHCEYAEDSDEPFTCFCNGKDYCNTRKGLRRVEREEVELVQCVCNGAHCKKDKTCLGELCTYVTNHRTKQVEQGCMNASVPLIERRSIGSCMVPPITGAMHHNVAKDAQSLLAVESCICGTDYCNSEKPEITVKENERGTASVEVTTMGTTTKSKSTSCLGEFIYTASIKSKIGMLQSFNSTGCISFTGDDPLPEELDPIGCATFSSENLLVKTCFKTKDKRAIGRARASKQVPEGKEKPSRKPSKSKQVEVEYDDDSEDDEKERKKQGKNSKSAKNRKEKIVKEEEEEEEEEVEDEAEAEAKEEGDKAEEEEEAEEKKEKIEEDEEEKSKKLKATTPKTFIFEKPTQPPIPDDSNTTMITVFALLILCILGSGIVIKFELHKKLKRSSYDTVAGG